VDGLKGLDSRIGVEALDGSGRLLFADSDNSQLRLLDLSQTVSGVVGGGNPKLTGGWNADGLTGDKTRIKKHVCDLRLRVTGIKDLSACCV